MKKPCGGVDEDVSANNESRKTTKTDVGSGNASDRADADAIRQIRNGDENRKALSMKYRSKLVSYARQILGDDQEAEDVAQDTLTKVFVKGSLEDFDISRPFLPWLISVCRNSALDAHRKRRRRKPPGKRQSSDLIPGSGKTVGHGLAGSESASVLLAGLSQMHREVIVLRVLLELSEAETAAILKVPIGTVSSRKNKAIEKMKEYLEGKERINGR